MSKEWLSVTRALQATCGGGQNQGFAIIEVRIVVMGKTPMLWSEPAMTKIHPKKAAGLQMTPGLASTLGMFIKADNNKTAG